MLVPWVCMFMITTPMPIMWSSLATLMLMWVRVIVSATSTMVCPAVVRVPFKVWAMGVFFLRRGAGVAFQAMWMCHLWRHSVVAGERSWRLQTSVNSVWWWLCHGRWVSCSPIGLQVFRQMLTCIIQLVLIQQNIKHLLQPRKHIQQCAVAATTCNIRLSTVCKIKIRAYGKSLLFLSLIHTYKNTKHFVRWVQNIKQNTWNIRYYLPSAKHTTAEMSGYRWLYLNIAYIYLINSRALSHPWFFFKRLFNCDDLKKAECLETIYTPQIHDKPQS